MTSSTDECVVPLPCDPGECPSPGLVSSLSSVQRPAPSVATSFAHHHDPQPCRFTRARSLTLSLPGSLPEDAHFAALPSYHDSPEYVALVKTKSTSNLLKSRAPLAIDTAKRMSFDAGQLDRMTR
jgi:hypothetical protein